MLPSRLLLAALAVAAPPAADKPAGPPADLRDLPGIQHLVYSPDGKSLLIHYNVPPRPGAAPKLGVWDVETGKLRVALENPPTSTEQIAFSPDGARAAAIGAGVKELKVWDAATGKLVQEFTLPDWKQYMPGAPFLGFSPDGNYITSVYKDKVLRAKLGGEAKLTSDVPLPYGGEFMAFAPAADLLVLAVNPPPGQKTGNKLLVYDTAKGGDPQTIPLTGWPRSIAITPDGKTLAIAYDFEVAAKTVPGKVELWDTQGWKVRSTLPPDQRADLLNYARLFISPDAKELIGTAVFNKGRVVPAELIDADGKVLRDVNAKILSDAAFSPDGATAAVVAGGKPALFLDAATGKDKEP